MIHVQIAPPHPLRVGHGSKNRMRLPLKIAGLSGEALQQYQDIIAIGCEITGRRTCLPGSTSGQVGVPFGHFIGDSNATHFTNQSGSGMGVTEIRSVDHGLSPMVTRNESARWQII